MTDLTLGAIEYRLCKEIKMPPHGEEIQLTDLEIRIMSAFIYYKILNDTKIITILRDLAKKLEGNRNETSI